MNVLDLCSGIGGFSLALKLVEETARTVGYVEIDEYCRETLRRRIREGYLDDAPIFHDLRAFDGRPYRGKVDCLSAGFPCQPFSMAGRRAGAADPRDLWPEVARIVREVGPGRVLLENVPGLLAGQRRRVRIQRIDRTLFGTLRCGRIEALRLPPYVGRVFGELATLGYDLWADCIPASAVGANHQRDRLWVVAYSKQFRWRGRGNGDDSRKDGEVQTPGSRSADERPHVADTRGE